MNARIIGLEMDVYNQLTKDDRLTRLENRIN